MTDIVNAESEMTTKENKPLTVRALIESLSTFPQDIELVAGIEGTGMTIALVGAMVVTSVEGVDLTILQLHRDSTVRALEYMMQKAETPS